MIDGEEKDIFEERRALLKYSACAGAALLAGEIPALAHAATAPGPGIFPEGRAQHAVDRFVKSMNCSQAVLETCAPAMGMSVDMARKVAAAFAGGMGMGSECGAVTGAVMVIGMKYGKTADNDPGADQATFSRVAQLMEQFRARHGHLNCSALLGCDMGTPAGVQEAAGKGLFTTRCPQFVRSAMEILDSILT